MTSQDGQRGSRRWTGIARGLTLIAVSVGVAIVVAELALRLAGIGSDQLLRPDPVLGVRFIASKTGLSQNGCYRARVSTNPAGWRSPDVSRTKPAGTSRVLVLGDSFMAGVQVNDNETFSSVLNDTLNGRRLGRQVEVINFGVPSWGTDQEYLSLREYGVAFKPDVVVLAFYAQNDVSDNFAALQGRWSSYPKPFFDIQDGHLVERPFRDPTPTWIDLGRRAAAPFRLYPWVRDSLIRIPVAHRLLYRMGIVGVVPRAEADPRSSGSGLQWPGRWRDQLAVYQRDDPTAWAHAWAITEGLLVRIRDEARRAQARLLLLHLADPVAVMPPAVRRGLVGEAAADTLDVDKPGRRLRELAQKHDVRFVSLVETFRDRIGDSVAEFERYYLRCDGHWTAAGHRLAAESVAPVVEAHVAEAGASALR